MVQVYKNGADRKVEVFDGEMLLKLTFTPDVDVEYVQEKPTEVTGALFTAGKHHTVKEQLLDEVHAKGNTEKEALVHLIEKLLAAAKEERIVEALETIKIRVIAEGICFTHALYVPPSERA